MAFIQDGYATYAGLCLIKKLWIDLDMICLRIIKDDTQMPESLLFCLRVYSTMNTCPTGEWDNISYICRLCNFCLLFHGHVNGRCERYSETDTEASQHSNVNQCIPIKYQHTLLLHFFMNSTFLLGFYFRHFE